MSKNYQAELVGVLGMPVAENPTGVMQEAAFQALGLNWRYLNIEVSPENLGDAMLGVRAMGFRGINLTIPHKVAVIPFLDALSVEADMIGAVNTVRRDGDQLIGENTDGKGFLRGLREDAKVDPRGKRVLILGAGGAARAISTELLLAGIASLSIVNRGPVRGRQLVADLQAHSQIPVQLSVWPEPVFVVPSGIDILINATSVGLFPNVEAMPAVDLREASPHMLVADAVFNPAQTRLLEVARTHGFPTLDGLSMLVYQGAIGFELWTGQRAPEAVMKAALAAELVK